MKNASKWCASFCAKNPIPSGLKKYGAVKKVHGEGGENVNTTEYDENTPLSSIKGNTTRALVATSRAYQKRKEEEERKKFEAESNKPQQSSDQNKPSASQTAATEKRGAVYKKGCKKY